MSNATHTPGPWKVVQYPYEAETYIKGPIGTAICQMRAYRENDPQLIACAPELLEALQEIFQHCVMIHSMWGDGNNQKEADIAIAKGRAVLAKVMGQEVKV